MCSVSAPSLYYSSVQHIGTANVLMYVRGAFNAPQQLCRDSDCAQGLVRAPQSCQAGFGVVSRPGMCDSGFVTLTLYCHLITTVAAASQCCHTMPTRSSASVSFCLLKVKAVTGEVQADFDRKYDEQCAKPCAEQNAALSAASLWQLSAQWL